MSSKYIEEIREALNGPYPQNGPDEVVLAAKEAGQALQKIGRILEMQGWDWNNYCELPSMLEKTIAELAIEKREQQ